MRGIVSVEPLGVFKGEVKIDNTYVPSSQLTAPSSEKEEPANYLTVPATVVVLWYTLNSDESPRPLMA